MMKLEQEGPAFTQDQIDDIVNHLAIASDGLREAFGRSRSKKQDEELRVVDRGISHALAMLAPLEYGEPTQ